MNRVVKQAVVGSVFALGLAVTPLLAQHDDHDEGAKASAAAALPLCPVMGDVMGEPINLAVHVATDEGPVFFCCKNCIPKYQADPAKYATQVAAQRKVLADRPKVQVTCPVTGEPVDPKVFVEHNGKKVFFCCKDCVKKYQRDPKKYAAKLASSFTYQTECPVTGEEIEPTVFAAAKNGMNVYFCCKNCVKKFFNDPQKYTPSLVAQGFSVDPKEMVRGADEHADHDHDHDAHDHNAHDHDGHDHDH